MEFRYGLWRGISAMTSQSGRQLGEANTRPFVFNRQIPTETAACKYDGSRFGRQINVSALRIAMACFDEASALTRAVIDDHFSRPPKPDLKPATLRPGLLDLFVVSRASLAVIAFRSRFSTPAGAPELGDVSIPSDVLASQYQFITGLFMIGDHMMEQADPRIASNASVSAKDLYLYADENEIFTSPNGMVCAGSKAKILEFLELCCSPYGDHHGAGRNLTDLVGSPSAWRDYALACIEFDCFLEIERLMRREKAGRENPTNPSVALADVMTCYETLAHYCTNTLGGPSSPEASTLGEGILARQNKILRLLGRTPIKSLKRHHLEERLAV
ncbi:MAG: hypothetical protein AAFY84_03340 [Pseudomonadota bacterium]